MLDDPQRAALARDGFVVIPMPAPPDLVRACWRAFEAEAARCGGRPPPGVKLGHHYRLHPQRAGSYWSQLDHSWPFLALELSAPMLDLAEGLVGEADFFYRNGGINELAPGLAFPWHRDTEDAYIEFMHYLSPASRETGCLRVVPGSHRLRVDVLHARLARARVAAGVGQPAVFPSVQLDAPMVGEAAVEVGPADLLLRSSRIFHATYRNQGPVGRVMHHWLFRERASGDHRFRFRDCLSGELTAKLTPRQRRALSLDELVTIHPRHRNEYEREHADVRWT